MPQELVTQEPFQLTPSEPKQLTPTGILGIIDRATRENVDVATLKELWAMNLAWEANEAKKAFNAAMTRFKSQPPTIRRVKAGPKLSGDKPAYHYATLEEVSDKLIPALNAVGIRHSWKTRYEGEWAIVTCRLTHDLGHFEEAEQRGCDDKGPGRNAIQAGASTVTYLQRYTLLAVSGMSVKGMDNDGAGANPNALDKNHVEERIKDIKLASSEADLTERFQHAYKEASDHNDKAAQDAYIAARTERKKAFRA